MPPPLDRQVKVCVLYEFKLGNVANLAFLNINRAFGEGTVTNTVVHRWYAKFRRGDDDLDKEPSEKLDDDEEEIIENPVEVEAKLARQYRVLPGTLYEHLDKLGRGEKLKEAQNEKEMNGEALDSTAIPSTSTGTADVSRSSSCAGSVTSTSDGDFSNVKLETPEDFTREVTLRDVMRAQAQGNNKRKFASSLYQQSNCNKVRLTEGSLDFREALNPLSDARILIRRSPPSSHPIPVGREIPRGSGVIARSLACLAKYRAENKTTVNLSQGVRQAKPPPIEEVSAICKEIKKEKAETVQLPNSGSEMKDHIVPMF